MVAKRQTARRNENPWVPRAKVDQLEIIATQLTGLMDRVVTQVGLLQFQINTINRQLRALEKSMTAAAKRTARR